MAEKLNPAMGALNFIGVENYANCVILILY